MFGLTHLNILTVISIREKSIDPY